ncbi:MAG: DUF2752 domain-containing protein [Planctomycetota bacterium]
MTTPDFPNSTAPAPAPGKQTDPPVPPAPVRSWSARLIALAIFVPTLAVLLTASSLTANAAGTGTHTQLGLAPCGFKAATGMPCATCGMTTAFTHAADGHFVASFVTQPAGLVLAVLTAMLVMVSGWSLATGVSLAPLGLALWRPRIVIVAIALLLSGWAYTALKTALLG